MSEGENVHATGIVLGGTGVMVRGPSGAGKSLLALLLIDDWERRGLAAGLVGDDRLDLTVIAGRLTMSGPPTIAGKIELRGRGILERPVLPRAVVDLVIDLVATLERMPEAAELTTTISGVRLARAPVPRLGTIDSAHQILLVREAITALSQ